MDQGQVAALGGMLCVAVLAGLIIGPLIGAVILRAAVTLYNKFAGGPDSPSAVPELGFGKAILAVLLSLVVNVVVGFGVGLVLGTGAAAAGANENSVNLMANLIGLPLGVLVLAGVLTPMLPTSFGRALLVALCHLLIVIMIAVAIVAVVFVGMMAFAG